MALGAKMSQNTQTDIALETKGSLNDWLAGWLVGWLTDWLAAYGIQVSINCYL